MADQALKRVPDRLWPSPSVPGPAGWAVDGRHSLTMLLACSKRGSGSREASPTNDGGPSPVPIRSGDPQATTGKSP